MSEPQKIIHIHYHIRQTPLTGLFKKLNTDPVLQYKIHIVMTYVWIANMAMAVSIFIFAQGFWQKASVLYLVLISLYANLATDYGAVPGAEAAISAEKINKKVEK